ncbi:OsmC family protein [Stenotrophomonas maltophilia]|uniref:Osmotically inducible protein OsmC n=1 Tax=Stenotrophomonas maltophilia TaxID=40324 RepID=A0A246IES7_STEMA|nr:OsmC family protein [Stenotrophomonas maltophilia]OWQ78017.1 hypothetical protein CEE63_03135 [Stenotrophomonas maltophilia]
MADHAVHLSTTWVGFVKGKGELESPGLQAPIAIPEHFGGTGKGANPKQLLMAAAASCYVMTFVAMAQARSIDATRISLSSDLSTRADKGLHLEHQVTVKLAPDATEEDRKAVDALISSADKACMVGNLLKAGGMTIEVRRALA